MEQDENNIIDILLEKARIAAETLDVYPVSEKTRVRSVSGKTDDREETVVETEVLKSQRLEGCIDVSRLKQISSSVKELNDARRRNDNDIGRLDELIGALFPNERSDEK